MFVNERFKLISEYLKEHKKASVEELAEFLYVSTATVRRDLLEMQKMGMVARTHGGALYIIIGIGINVTTADFPEELKAVAGSIGKTDRVRLCADICNGLYDIEKKDYIDCYRKRLLWRGEQIVYTENNVCHDAVLVDVDGDGHLIVMENGNKKTLRSGEISVRAK